MTLFFQPWNFRYFFAHEEDKVFNPAFVSRQSITPELKPLFRLVLELCVYICVFSLTMDYSLENTQAKLKPDKFKQNTSPVSPLRSVFANRQCQASSFCHLNAPREGSCMKPRQSGVYDLWGIVLGVYVLLDERAGSKNLITEREIN